MKTSHHLATHLKVQDLGINMQLESLERTLSQTDNEFILVKTKIYVGSRRRNTYILTEEIMKAFRGGQYLDRFNNPNVGYVERDTQQDPKTAKLNKKPFSLWLNTEDTVRSERTTQEIENQIYLAEKMTRESKRHREDTIRLMKELISLTEISNTVMNDVRFTMIANNCKRLLDTFDV